MLVQPAVSVLSLHWLFVLQLGGWGRVSDAWKGLCRLGVAIAVVLRCVVGEGSGDFAGDSRWR